MKRVLIIGFGVVFIIVSYVSSQKGKVMGKDFIDKIIPLAVAAEKVSRIPAEVVVGQAILESNSGDSKLTKQANNLFGIKASGGWTGPTVAMPTTEIIKGKKVKVEAQWRKYPNWEASVDDHAEFLKKPRYRLAFYFTDHWDQFLYQVHKAGYATDPTYVKQIVNIVKGNIAKRIKEARYAASRE